jgi:hypothetical protein
MGADMTKWIDDYAKSLGKAANSDNVQRQHDVLRDRLIQQHGPKFFEKLKHALRSQADELDERVGASLKGITATDDRNPAAIVVSAGDGSISLRCTSNLPVHTVSAVSKRTNSICGVKERTFRIAVNEKTAQISLRSDPDPAAYEDAILLATKLLREAFTGVWVD